MFTINNITYRIDYRPTTKKVIIDDIYATDNIFIPTAVLYKDMIYYVAGFSIQCFNNIKNKNISYFNIDEQCSYLESIDGVAYYKTYQDGKKVAIALIPPKLNITELILPKNYYNTLYLYHFCTNNNLKTLIINQKNIIIDPYKFGAVPDLTLENIIYNNKTIKKINNKWIIKK